MDDDWHYWPQQFGLGSTHDLSEAPGKPSRLAGFRSVRNLLGGKVTPSTPEPRNPIGFHRVKHQQRLAK